MLTPDISQEAHTDSVRKTVEDGVRRRRSRRGLWIGLTYRVGFGLFIAVIGLPVGMSWSLRFIGLLLGAFWLGLAYWFASRWLARERDEGDRGSKSDPDTGAPRR